jgi:hypothetical protein
MPAKLNFFKTPASVRLVSSRTVSTSTGISGCYQPHRQKVMPGQKSIYEMFLLYTSRFKKCCVNCELLYYPSTEFKSALNVQYTMFTMVQVRLLNSFRVGKRLMVFTF